jgi:Sec-independent protein secretion pathway component TatC
MYCVCLSCILSISIRPTLYTIMSSLVLYIQELYYRMYYVCMALALSCSTAWIYRYTYIHIYIAPVTHRLYVFDVGEDIRMGVYISVYLGCMWSLGYIYYVYTCYMAPGRYIYEHTTHIGVWVYILSVYIWGVYCVWPEVYGVFLGMPMGVQDMWGFGVDTMPRIQSLVMWSLWVPLGCVFLSMVPVYGYYYVHGVWLQRYRRTWYVCSVLCASAVCPPHPWFQVCVSLIFWLFYEFTLLGVCIRQCVSKTSTT